MQLTLSIGSVGKAPFQSHNLHEHPHWDAQCCQLTQLSSVLLSGSDSPSAVDSGFRSVRCVGGGWLSSGSRVRLVLSSSAGQMVNAEPLFTSTHSIYAAIH